jgi:hypothetical protein
MVSIGIKKMNIINMLENTPDISAEAYERQFIVKKSPAKTLNTAK